MSDEEHHLELAAAPADALAAVAATAEEWGGLWSPEAGGGRLVLPVLAGLRRGVVAGPLAARPIAGGTRLTLTVESVSWRLHRTAAAVLVLGALGALPVLFWPLDERLLALAPPGLVLLLVAWFLVSSRLRTAGVDSFLAAVRERLAGAAPPG